jgi:hypothetical protein
MLDIMALLVMTLVFSVKVVQLQIRVRPRVQLRVLRVVLALIP